MISLCGVKCEFVSANQRIQCPREGLGAPVGWGQREWGLEASRPQVLKGRHSSPLQHVGESDVISSSSRYSLGMYSRRPSGAGTRPPFSFFVFRKSGN
jgi:hypothetical protein